MNFLWFQEFGVSKLFESCLQLAVKLCVKANNTGLIFVKLGRCCFFYFDAKKNCFTSKHSFISKFSKPEYGILTGRLESKIDDRGWNNWCSSSMIVDLLYIHWRNKIKHFWYYCSVLIVLMILLLKADKREKRLRNYGLSDCSIKFKEKE
jgi:hypothetical protein